MSPPQNKTEHGESFRNYFCFVSDMLGGDLMPLNHKAKALQKIISHRAIDYDLMRSIVAEVQNQNTVFQLHERLAPYPTLDALGNVRGNLLRNRGDIHQISLIDRIGEITVSFFNLPQSLETDSPKTHSGRVVNFKPSP